MPINPPVPQSKAKCTRCGATAQADTFEQAKNKLDHAIGLARGITCGASYGKVIEIGKPKPPVQPSQTLTKQQTVSDTSSPKIEKTTSKKFKYTKS